MMPSTSTTTMLLLHSRSTRPGTGIFHLRIHPRYATSAAAYATILARRTTPAATLSAAPTTTPSHPHIGPSTVNAPISTLPAPLDLPTRTANQSAFTYYFSLSKGYLTFFKTGLLNTLANFKDTRALQSRIDAPPGDGTITKMVELDKITRAEMQHLVRARHDFRRLPVFGLIFLLCGEFSPLVLPFVAGVVPYTCRIPRQLERERRILDEKRQKLLDSWREPGEVAKGGLKADGEWWHVATVLGVAPKVLKFPAWIKHKVNKQVEYLGLDDQLLERGGGARALNVGEELVMACQERGLETRGKTEQQMRTALENWLQTRKRLGEINPALWLVRPERWSEIKA